MKISFSTPLKWSDLSAIAAADAATETFKVFIDTVNPPVKNYQVPAANFAAGTPNADGSKQITVDATADLGVAVTPGVKYYVAAQDAVDGILSAETAILTYVSSATPAAPGNFSVA